MNTTAAPSIRTEVAVPLHGGAAKFISFHNLSDPAEHVAVAFGNWREQEVPLVRVHSECLTGDLFASEKCDCGNQLKEATEACRAENGIILYLRQEGRGIGLYKKLEAYELQNQGLDTYEANRRLHQPEDARNFEVAAEMLKALGFSKVRLLSNNPEKRHQLEEFGIEVAEMISTGVYLKDHNKNYLKAKRDHHKHNIKL